MNITMEDVTFIDALGGKSSYESFFVQNRLIRYVQIPHKVDMMEALKSGCEG